MDAKELIRAGKLQEARSLVTEEVKEYPADSARRTLLFQVLSLCGEWDKAERHLDILVVQDPRTETGVQVYRNLISAERKRSEFVQGKGRPSFMTGIPPWLETYFQACEKLNNGELEEASRLFLDIDSSMPEMSGELDGKPFKGFMDTDSFLAGFLEVFIHDSYLWFPFSSLRELSVSEPKSQFDLLWVPARIATAEGLALGCYLPVLYPDSFQSDDDLVRLGRITDWGSLGGGFYRGKGQHVFLIGGNEKGILEIRDVRFNDPVKGGV